MAFATALTSPDFEPPVFPCLQLLPACLCFCVPLRLFASILPRQAGTLATARVAPLPPGNYDNGGVSRSYDAGAATANAAAAAARYQNVQPLPPPMPAPPPAPRYIIPQQQGARVAAVNADGLAYGARHLPAVIRRHDTTHSDAGSRSFRTCC